MQSRVAGIVSLLMVLGAASLAAAVAFTYSAGWGTAYLAIAGTSSIAIIAVFCARCPCRDRCGHVVPGMVARWLFPGTSPGEYGAIALAVTVAALLALLGVPLAWMWRSTAALGVYVVLLIGAGVLIRGMVCPRCDNAHCPARPGA